MNDVSCAEGDTIFTRSIANYTSCECHDGDYVNPCAPYHVWYSFAHVVVSLILSLELLVAVRWLASFKRCVKLYNNSGFIVVVGFNVCTISLRIFHSG